MTTDKTTMATKIAQLREKMEEMVKNHGYCIQGVGGSEESDPYIYTFGRNDTGKPDIYIPNAPASLSGLVKECIDIIDQGRFVDGEIYESSIFVVASNQSERTEASKFRMEAIDASRMRDITLGIFNRGKPIEDIRIVKVTLADHKNQFPEV